jgi:hypothetical protein
MELVDKFYGWKGFLTTVLLICIGMITFFSLFMVFDAVFFGWKNTEPEEYLLVFFVLTIFAAPFIWVGIWLLRKESFAYTHYPIRLNRKTRMVHVFRTNGTVLSVPWDEVFFCLGPLPQNIWEIQGHILDKDKITVRETFAFMLAGSGKYERDHNLPRYWEFVRRYMEDGPATLLDDVKICLPIVDKRESFSFGFHRTHFDVGAIPFILQAFILLIYLVIYPGRYIAMRTSKIPQWPQEIEAVNVVEPNDPYFRDASMNPKD